MHATLHHHETGPRPINLRGWRRSHELAHRYLKLVFLAAALPEVVDLRTLFPPVDDQGELGSCTAHGVIAIVEFNELRRQRQLARDAAFDAAPAAPAITVSAVKAGANGRLSYTTTIVPATQPTPQPPQPKPPTFTHGARLAQYYWSRLIEGTVNEDSGATITDAVKATKIYGVGDESLWPYDVSKFTVAPTAPVVANAAAHKVTDEAAVPQDLTTLKSTLASGTPIVFGFDVYDYIMSAEFSKGGKVLQPPGQNGIGQETLQGGHCVVLVGYDDKKQAFLVRNSWGSGWGEGGHFWMSYSYVTNPKLASDFRVIKSAPI